MAPKMDKEDASVADLETLCVLMATATDFKPNLEVVAKVIGVPQPSDVVHRISTIIGPVGYAMEDERIIKLVDRLVTPPTNPPTDNPSINNPSINNPSSKKRKIHEVSDTDDSETETPEEDSPATAAIKVAMAGSDVEDTGNSDTSDSDDA